MKIVYEPKIELTTDEICAVDKVLSLLGQIYTDSTAPMDAEAETLQLHISDFCESYVDNWED